MSSQRLHLVHVCVCVCVSVCVCVYIRLFIVKASSVWISWNAREQINDVMLKTFFSYAKSLHRYFRMKHQTFLLATLSCLQTRNKQSYDLTGVPLFTIIRHGPHSAQHRRRQALTRRVAI